MTGIADLYLYLKKPHVKDRRKRLLAHFTAASKHREEPTPFVVLSWKRTGSNLLCGYFHMHPEILMHNELFNPIDIFTYFPNTFKKQWTVLTRDLFPGRFLDYVYTGRNENGSLIKPSYKAVGFKSFPEHWIDVQNEDLRGTMKKSSRNNSTRIASLIWPCRVSTIQTLTLTTKLAGVCCKTLHPPCTAPRPTSNCKPRNASWELMSTIQSFKTTSPEFVSKHCFNHATWSFWKFNQPCMVNYARFGTPLVARPRMISWYFMAMTFGCSMLVGRNESFKSLRIFLLRRVCSTVRHSSP
jgi:hypothetical protein